MKKCFIFGALPIEKTDYEINGEDLIIAADKGLETLKKLSIIPDLVIGDFDSLGYVPKEKNVKKLPVEKDDTDVGYAIKYAFEKGYRDFIIYGCIGGLLDHTLANISLACYISKRGGKAVFAGEKYYITAITDSSISVEKGKGRISVFSADEKCWGVTLKGFKYPLDNAELTNDFPLGVSNEFKDDFALISVKKGTLVIVSCTILKI